MKTWIDWMNRIAAGMLFHGGYVTAPRLRVIGQSAPAARDERPQSIADHRAGCGDEGRVSAETRGYQNRQCNVTDALRPGRV